jgi:formyl-CoA transferase
VHTSLLQAMIGMLDFQATRWLIDKRVPPQAGNDHPTGVPTGVFPTSDGHINIAASGGALYERLCHTIGKPEMITDPRFRSGGARSKNRVELNAEIAEVTVTRSSDEWVDLLNEAGVPCGPIYTIDQTFADRQVQHLGIARPVTHPARGEIEVVGQSINLSRTPQPERMRRHPPSAGEHSDDVLGAAGFSAEEIAHLREQGVV